RKFNKAAKSIAAFFVSKSYLDDVICGTIVASRDNSGLFDLLHVRVSNTLKGLRPIYESRNHTVWRVDGI
ncbi:hypothetical protein R7O13_31315, partial [Vibrio sp. Y176]